MFRGGDTVVFWTRVPGEMFGAIRDRRVSRATVVTGRTRGFTYTFDTTRTRRFRDRYRPAMRGARAKFS